MMSMYSRNKNQGDFEYLLVYSWNVFLVVCQWQPQKASDSLITGHYQEVKYVIVSDPLFERITIRLAGNTLACVRAHKTRK